MIKDIAKLAKRTMSAATAASTIKPTEEFSSSLVSLSASLIESVGLSKHSVSSTMTPSLSMRSTP